MLPCGLVLCTYNYYRANVIPACSAFFGREQMFWGRNMFGLLLETRITQNEMLVLGLLTAFTYLGIAEYFNKYASIVSD